MTFPNGYVQQFPGQPQFPGQAQQYPAQPQQGGYAPVGVPQGYGHQLPPQAAPVTPPASGSLDDFFSQPSVGGGPALKFEVNTTHVGLVARPVTNADIRQQTIPGSNAPATYRDGRPKWVMVVPLVVQQSPAYPEGQAQWYVAGGARDELVRAMAEAGAPAGPPEAGALISITCTGTRSSGPGMNPAKVYKIVYQRPEGAATAAATPEPVAEAPAPAAPSTTPAVQAPAPTAPQPPADMSPEQQALLSRLGG